MLPVLGPGAWLEGGLAVPGDGLLPGLEGGVAPVLLPVTLMASF